jgi:hypothetical protein
VVIDARIEAEAASKAALQALAIDHHEPFAQMSPEDRELRIRLRARARQLGDPRDPKRSTQAISHLIGECAYEQWHRMLFARFLAENDLLIEPDSGVAVSLDECRELARECREDPWVLASRFAQRVLPQIFRPDDPVLQVGLSREHRSRLESLLEKLPPEIFRADDSLGWVYQFWQSKRKGEVNAAGGKIGADELAPVTQLFTEHYIVLFLLHNTIGAWHAGKILTANPELARSASNEEELRKACALIDYQWDYLRFVREEGGNTWRPAAGTFEKWPRTAREITVMDPCCGSGHFLVAVFECLVRLRMVEERLSPEEAVQSVLADNLFGLELDPRCTQLAAFALAFAAWRFVGRVIFLPSLNVACSGLSVGVREEEWTLLADEDTRLRKGMQELYALFRQGPELGSLIDPRRVIPGDLFTAGFRQLQPLLEAALSAERTRTDATVVEVGVTAEGMARSAELLAGKYTLVMTNVPYLVRGKQDQILKDHIAKHYSEGKSDLATAFVLRCLGFLIHGGTVAVVTPHNCLFMMAYHKFRVRLLKEAEWDFVARIGEHGFESTAAAGAFTAMLILTHLFPTEWHVLSGLDASALPCPSEKAEWLLKGGVLGVSQAEQSENPDSVVSLVKRAKKGLLGDIADTWQGIVTSDDNKYILRFWELNLPNARWVWMQMPPQETTLFTGRETVLRWEGGKGSLRKESKAHNFPSSRMLGRPGVAIQRMRSMNATLFSGEIFDDSVAPLVPNSEDNLPALWCFCSSGFFRKEVRKVDQTLRTSIGAFLKTEFDCNHWKTVAAEKYPAGLPAPYSDDSTQWLFHGHPVKSMKPIQVAVARLLGYRWPVEVDLNIHLAPEAKELVACCRDLLSFSENDGIVCLSPVRGEAPAADRLRTLLATAFREAWTTVIERDLIGQTGSRTETFNEWLRDDFFLQHCTLFHQRPFIWHIWDGRKDGFHALVNYHKLAEGEGKGRMLLESLTYSYLGDWIARQKAAIQDGEAGADGRLAAAMELQGEMAKIIEGEPPYDIFVRWKPLHLQPIGWNPDINDGVRVNIRPFMSASLSKGRAGAGVLRWKPNIKWEKDRGKEPNRPREEYPWFWNGGMFAGERHNDHHYSNAEKLAARDKHAGEPA